MKYQELKENIGMMMMMIMRVDRQDFDDILCQQKTSQNKQIPVCPANA